MRSLAALLMLALLAGCASLPNDEPSTTVDAQQSAPSPGCESGSKTLLEWAAPDEADASGASNFTLEPGAQALDVAWTKPTTFAGSYSLSVTAPDEYVVFAARVDQGAQGPGSTVVVGGTAGDTSNVRNPPLAGEYAFAYEIDGVMEGASLVVTATGCWASQAP